MPYIAVRTLVRQDPTTNRFELVPFYRWKSLCGSGTDHGEDCARRVAAYGLLRQSALANPLRADDDHAYVGRSTRQDPLNVRQLGNTANQGICRTHASIRDKLVAPYA